MASAVGFIENLSIVLRVMLLRRQIRVQRLAADFFLSPVGAQMKILLWIVVIIFLIGLLVVSGVLGLIF
jgi:hypothetical protein